MLTCLRRCLLAAALAAPSVLTVTVAVPLLPAGAPLPDVETVLSKARSKADDFAVQARVMQVRVEEEQAKSHTVLKAAREEYEHKLKAQLGENTKIEGGNTALHYEIRQLRNRSAMLEEEARKLATANDEARKALSAIQNKVEAAEVFLKDSLLETNDAGAQDLLVLESTTPKPTLDRFLKIAQGGPELALLQLGSGRLARTRLAPRLENSEDLDLVHVLSASLGAISSAASEGAAQLQASFLENFAAGQKRKDELLAVQKKLTETRDLLNTTEGQLMVARDHLKDRSRQLRSNLQGLRVFARKFDAMAVSALNDEVAKAEANHTKAEANHTNSSASGEQARRGPRRSATKATTATTQSPAHRAPEKVEKPMPSMSVATTLAPKEAGRTPGGKAVNGSAASAVAASNSSASSSPVGNRSNRVAAKPGATEANHVPAEHPQNERQHAALVQSQPTSAPAAKAGATQANWPVFGFLRWR